MTPAELHRQARPRVVAGFVERYQREPTIEEVQPVQGVGWLETRYNTAWKGAGVTSNNWGAIQSGRPPCPVATSFQYTDSSPQPDGTNKPYVICFRRYATPELGASDLVRVVYVRRPSVLAAAQSANLYAVSAALHQTRYYEGWGATIAQRIANHHKALTSAVRGIATALGEPFVDTPIPVPEPWQDDFLPDNPMILSGSRGPYVKVWQGDVLNPWLDAQRLDAIVADGAFGPITKATTRIWQKFHALQADGVVGPLTWGKAAEVA